MVSFEEAVDIAIDNAKSLIPNAKNFSLEGVLISDDKKLYEVTLSYEHQGKDPLSSRQHTSGQSRFFELAQIMSIQRQYKTFLVNKNNGDFRGFRNQKDRC